MKSIVIIRIEQGVIHMRQLKARLSKLKASISIQTYKRPMVFLISIMILINLLILIVSALIAFRVDDSFSSVIDALVNGSLKWMLTPNAILTVENPLTMVLAVFVLITGLVLFSGTIIALTTNALKDYFQKKQSGGGKIILENHIIILHWNNKVPELVADLIHMDSHKVTIMVLADIEKIQAERMIALAVMQNQKTKKKITNLNVLVKSGNPLNLDDLDDISIQAADSILIMSKDGDVSTVADFYKSDLLAIKQVLALGQIDLPKSPPIIVEVKDIETKHKLINLSKVVKPLQTKHIIPICFDRRLGQIIAQTISDSRMEDIYLELFSFRGSEIYAIEKMTFEECLLTRSHAIPLSTNDHHLFVLSESALDAKQINQTVLNPKTLNVKILEEKNQHTIFIMGNNHKLPFIMESFKLYGQMHESTFKSQHYQDNQIKEALDAINELNQPATLILLSDEDKPKDALDANVLDHLIYLQTRLKNPNVKIIVELLDPKNDHLFKDFAIENTIISNKIISLLLSKLALFKETADFYDDLLTISPKENSKDSQAITIYPATSCFSESFPMLFESKKHLITSVYHSFNQSVMIIGFIRDQVLHLLDGDLNKAQTVEIRQTDDCVFFRI
jgi:hypothetical protein